MPGKAEVFVLFSPFMQTISDKIILKYELEEMWRETITYLKVPSQLKH